MSDKLQNIKKSLDELISEIGKEEFGNIFLAMSEGIGPTVQDVCEACGFSLGGNEDE